jgi:hypothetical protein
MNHTHQRFFRPGRKRVGDCIPQHRTGAAYRMGCPLYSSRGYSNFLFMR